ncbi:hypothetical protein [Micromonospora sp. RTP1Z1]|uniref:hypothetical protein n=1 Tax=Micromonospora sp. RTP1Z1 TaxID=2994043 RepID=UPI0039B4FC47
MGDGRRRQDGTRRKAAIEDLVEPRDGAHHEQRVTQWLNLVERWFAELTGKMIRRGVFHSVGDLVQAIEEYLRVHNDDPKPFVWTTTAEPILEKVRRGRVTLQQTANQN